MSCVVRYDNKDNDNNMPKKEAINKNMPKKEDMNKNTPKKEDRNKNMPKKEDMNKNILKKEGMNKIKDEYIDMSKNKSIQVFKPLKLERNKKISNWKYCN